MYGDLAGRLKDLSDRPSYRANSDGSSLGGFFKGMTKIGLGVLLLYVICTGGKDINSLFESSEQKEKKIRLKQAEEMVKQGVAENNISLILESIKLSEGNPYFYCEAGDYYLENGDFRTGVDYYVKALEKDPDYIYAEYCLNFYNLWATHKADIKDGGITQYNLRINNKVHNLLNIEHPDKKTFGWNEPTRSDVKEKFLDLYQRTDHELWKKNMSDLIKILDTPDFSKKRIPKMDNYGNIKYIEIYK